MFIESTCRTTASEFAFDVGEVRGGKVLLERLVPHVIDSE